MGDASRLIRWGLAVIGLGCLAVALWLFLDPFRVQVFKDPEVHAGDTIDPNTLRGDLAVDCSAPFRQLVGPPAEAPGVPFVSVANLQPICRNVGRDRALASLGFALAALCAFAGAATARRSKAMPAPGS
jgi:hypothetical protein